MWRRRLNSATLANATHKELGKVADGTSTQVRIQMINRWRVKMIQKGLYKVGDSPQSSYTDSASSDLRPIEINILTLCLVVTY